MTSRQLSVGFFVMAIVAVMALPASANLIAYYPCDDIFIDGGWNYTTNEVAGWGNALINQDSGLPKSSVVSDPDRGSVLQMDANWSAINVGSHVLGGTDGAFTAMVWAKTSTGAAGFAPLIMKRDGGWGDTYWQFSGQGSGTLKIESPADGPYGAAGSFMPNEWTHYAVTGIFMDPDNEPNELTVEVFTNGISQMTPVKITVDPLDVSRQITVANTHTGKTHATVGSLWDDIRFYDAVLSESEIQQAAGIPEPSTIAMLLGGLFLLLARRRR